LYQYTYLFVVLGFCKDISGLQIELLFGLGVGRPRS